MRKAQNRTDVPVVSIVVLSHDRPAYLPKVLDSIAGQSYRNLEIMVVDNKSCTSDEIAEIVCRYAGVKLIQNSANLGFTGGMNRGIEAATGDYVHCTLDDVLLDRDCISFLVNHDLQQPTEGLLSGILLNEDGRTIRCAGGEFLLSPIYRQNFFAAGEKDTGNYQEPYQVKYVQGGMIFSRLDFMKRLNGFRREFFMYAEDTELCARVAKAGYTITVVPQARARVLDAPHAFKSEGIAFHKIKNLFSLYLLHARLRVLPEFYLRYGVINLLRAFISERKIVWPMIKAWGWFLLKAPALVKERCLEARLRQKHERSLKQSTRIQATTTSR